jgi:hypothetical protein
MTTYREVIHMVLDKLKTTSKDSIYTEDHIAFLATRYRALLLRQRYSDVRRDIAEPNFQTLSSAVQLVPAISGTDDFGEYLRSSIKIPDILNFNGLREITSVTSEDFLGGEFSIVGRDRFQYVGNNPWLRKAIYCSICPDKYLYFKSANPQHKYLENIQITSIFENPIEVYKLINPLEDPYDKSICMEDTLIADLINVLVKDLSPSLYLPEDKENDSNDGLSDLNINK